RDVAGCAIHYARTGFPAHVGLLEQEGYGIRDCAEFFSREWPHSAALYLPSGKVPQTAQVLRNSPYADFLELLCIAEDSAAGGRAAKLGAVYEAFYNGEPASIIAKFSRASDGLLARGDLQGFQTYVEDPACIE